MNNDTQPLTQKQQVAYDQALQRIRNGHPYDGNTTLSLTTDQEPDLDYPEEKQASLQKWGPIAEQQFLAEQSQLHIHGPFTFLLNQNHNALRGCQSCGQTWVGLMAGDADNIQWHPVSEPSEEENE